MRNAPATVTGFNALSPQQQQEHRAKIGVRAEAILGQFWRDDKTPEAVRAVELEGWMDVLESCSHSEIRRAWATYQRNGPRTQSGKLYKPDAGAIWKIVIEGRPKPKIVPTAPPPEREPGISLEEKARIVREMCGDDVPESLGGIVKTFGQKDQAE